MHLTRRYFLQTTGVLAAYMGIAPMDLLAAARVPGLQVRRVAKGKTLVVVFLRGGADGLNLVVPFKDKYYKRLRPTLAVGAPATLKPGRARPDDILRSVETYVARAHRYHRSLRRIG